MENLIKDKRRLYEIWLTTQDPEDRKKYVRQSKVIKNEVRKSKNECWGKKCEDVERYLGGSRTKEAWNLKIPPIKKKEWVDHFQSMLTEDIPEYIKEETETYDTELIPAVSTEEVRKAAMKMKNGKSAGPRGIPVEL